MRILIIGGGNMGLTYAQSFLHSHIVTQEKLFILERSPEKAAQIRQAEIGSVFTQPGDYIKNCDLIIFAVKPQDSNMLYPKIRDHIGDQQVVLSIMAGVKIETIKHNLNTNKIIRAMPNLPAQVGEGMTVFSSSAEVTRIELVMVQNLLNATGKTIYVENEELINAATAISGSGPAYIFFFMQSLIEAAEEMGFNQSEAELLSYQTFKGAVESYNKFDLSCNEWIAKVSSRGGTTEAAFDAFMENKVKEELKNAYSKALLRAKELSKN